MVDKLMNKLKKDRLGIGIEIREQRNDKNLNSLIFILKAS